ncbi:LysR family transcriptional regulator [Paraburkholderia caribensis]|uniref:LysR family transcriptional regulator n=1 Tax=Paraburkholderia caribensis TaxID=75105 RepID=UPI0031E380CE
MDKLDRMRIFVRVVDAKGFTAAARSLDLNPGAVSRAVAELEAHLRTRLLNRSTRSLSLTSAGLKYVQRCRSVLAEVALAEEEASDAHLYPTGTLKIHSYTSIGQRYVLPAIDAYRKAHSDVVVELRCFQAMPELFDGSSDVAVVAAQTLPDSDLIAHQIGSTFSVLCASEAYLAMRGTPQVPSELVGHDCLTLQVATPDAGTLSLEGPSGLEEIPVHSVLQTNVSEAIVLGARRGMGIGILPMFAAVDDLVDGSLVRVLPDYQLQPMNIFALYPSRQFVDAKIATWMQCLQSYLPKAMKDDEAKLQLAAVL